MSVMNDQKINAGIVTYKHYMRKHGPNAYYGQEKSDSESE